VIEQGFRLAKLAIELRDARHLRNLLLAMLALSLAIQAYALRLLIVTNRGWLGSILSTGISVVLLAWAGLTQRKVQRLEDEVES
jgi:hypothetical protein